MLYAAKGGKVDMIKLLVSHGASIHDKNDVSSQLNPTLL